MTTERKWGGEGREQRTAKQSEKTEDRVRRKVSQMRRFNSKEKDWIKIYSWTMYYPEVTRPRYFSVGCSDYF
jgi:hypothetical protein